MNRDEAVAVYASLFDDPEQRARVHGAAMLALSFCASQEGFARFRRWLTENPVAGAAPEAVTQQGITVAAQVLAAVTILESQKGTQL